MCKGNDLPVDVQIVTALALIHKHGYLLDEIVAEFPQLTEGIAQMRSNMAS